MLLYTFKMIGSVFSIYIYTIYTICAEIYMYMYVCMQKGRIGPQVT